jgi:hypothetical protein
MAGGGEVIPNGSIHWNIVHEDAGGNVKDGCSVQFVDPTPVSQVGRGTDHRGKLRVQLRFKTEQEARAALERAEQGVCRDAKSGMFEVVLDVTPVQRTRKQADAPYPNTYAQVRVDW